MPSSKKNARKKAVKEAAAVVSPADIKLSAVDTRQHKKQPRQGNKGSLDSPQNLLV